MTRNQHGREAITPPTSRQSVARERRRVVAAGVAAADAMPRTVAVIPSDDATRSGGAAPTPGQGGAPSTTEFRDAAARAL